MLLYSKRTKSKEEWKSKLKSKDVSVCLLKKIKVPGVHYASKILIDGRFAISSNNDILIFNLSNWKCELIIKGNSNTIIDIEQLKNGKLITISDDIKIYSITQNCYRCEHTFKECNHPKQIVELNNNTILCLDESQYFKILNTNKPYNLISIFDKLYNVNYDLIYKCKIKNMFMASYKYIDEVVFWSLDTKQLITSVTTVQCDNYKTIVEIDNKMIFGGSLISLVILNMKTLTIEAIFWRSCSYLVSTFTCNIVLTGEICLLGDHNGILKIYDVKKNVHRLLPIHKEDIQAIYLITQREIITCSKDNYIKILRISDV